MNLTPSWGKGLLFPSGPLPLCSYAYLFSSPFPKPSRSLLSPYCLFALALAFARPTQRPNSYHLDQPRLSPPAIPIARKDSILAAFAKCRFAYTRSRRAAALR